MEAPSGIESVGLTVLSIASVVAALVVLILWYRNQRRR
ncbi:hypothetical protein KIPE111705_13960 [Kibdelosporangium persicum]